MRLSGDAQPMAVAKGSASRSVIFLIERIGLFGFIWLSPGNESLNFRQVVGCYDTGRSIVYSRYGGVDKRL